LHVRLGYTPATAAAPKDTATCNEYYQNQS